MSCQNNATIAALGSPHGPSIQNALWDVWKHAPPSTTTDPESVKAMWTQVTGTRLATRSVHKAEAVLAAIRAIEHHRITPALQSALGFASCHFPSIEPMVARIRAQGGRVYVVGGAVRDGLLGRAPKDIDVEVFGVDADHLVEVLQTLGPVNAVGKSFGVLKVQTCDGEIDVAIPRREERTGAGHRGFSTDVDPWIDPRKAAARRDFTINALFLDPETGDVIDYFDGIHDLQLGIIRATSEAFAEDPLRVLRAVQFAARFGMTIDSSTVEQCRKIRHQEPDLSRERVWGEWQKIWKPGSQPAIGFATLREVGWEPPWLAVLDQAEWHHRVAATTTVAQSFAGDIERAIAILSVLHHSAVIDRSGWLADLGVPSSLHPTINALEQHWMLPCPQSDEDLRRAAVALTPASLRLWLACHHARGTPNLEQVVVRAEALDLADHPMPPLVQGRDLLAIGFPAGPHLGKLLKQAYEAQLTGSLTAETKQAWLATMRYADSGEESQIERTV